MNFLFHGNIPEKIFSFLKLSKLSHPPPLAYPLPCGRGLASNGMINLKPLRIFQTPVEFKPLIPKLKFIKNKKKWSGHLMGKAMREIPKEDYELIMSLAK